MQEKLENEFYASAISQNILYNLGMIAVHIYKCFAKGKEAKEIVIILHNLFDPIVLSLRQIVTLEGEKKIQKLEGLLRPLPSLYFPCRI